MVRRERQMNLQHLLDKLRLTKEGPVQNVLDQCSGMIISIRYHYSVGFLVRQEDEDGDLFKGKKIMT